MSPKNPPAIATWMLEHLTLGRKDEALAGDLLEEFRRGRPAAWYWRQVLVAITVGFTSEVRTQWPGNRLRHVVRYTSSGVLDAGP